MPKRSNHPLLTLLQYLLAIGVLVVHSGSLFPDPLARFIAKSLYGRLAVPVFLVSSAYFLSKKEQEKSGATSLHFKRLAMTYLKWSLFYLPYAMAYFLSLDLPIYLLPIALLVALLYLGTCYQLWYLPALFLGHFLVKAGRKVWSSKALWLVASSLYLLGSLETYTGYLEGTALGAAYQAYASIFVTSRNGLFYVPVFLLLGQALADHETSDFLTKQPARKLLFALFVWFVEAGFVYVRQGLDKNFFLVLPLVALFLVNWCLKSDIQLPVSTKSLRSVSYYLYFLHPLFIEVGLWGLSAFRLESWQEGRAVFFLALLGCHLVAWLMIRSQRR